MALKNIAGAHVSTNAITVTQTARDEFETLSCTLCPTPYKSGGSLLVDPFWRTNLILPIHRAVRR
jgi:hypothetical protein